MPYCAVIRIYLVSALITLALVSCVDSVALREALVPIHEKGEKSVEFSSNWKISPQNKSLASVRSSVARTVMAAQYESGFYKNPKTGKPLNIYLAKDLLLWQGAPESTKGRFLKEPFPKNSPYNQPWVYERWFTASGLQRGDVVWLELEDLNYEARVLINGRVVREKLVGPYRRHKIPIRAEDLGSKNRLELTVTPPPIGSLTRAWLDWHASPPDKMLGQKIGSIYPRTKISGKNAKLKLEVEVLGDSVADEVLVEIGGKQYLYDLDRASSSKSNDRVYYDLSDIKVEDAKLWWANRQGPQNLYDLQVYFLNKNQVVSEKKMKIGLREVESYLDHRKNRQFRLNGEEVRIVGAGWSSDFTLNEPMSEKWKKLKLLKDAGYNAIRQEGTMESSEFYQMTDELGIMVLAGWACCTQWESSAEGEMWGVINPHWVWTEEKYEIAEKSLRDQLLKLRQNPSFIGWFNGSDYAPHEELERRYKKVYRNVLGSDWKKMIIPRASENERTRKSKTFGRSGSQMEGPYEHVTAQYWEDPESLGFAKGFHSELGPGVSFPSLAALRELSPNLNPYKKLFDKEGTLLDENLSAHAGHKSFGEMRHFYEAICARYGEPKNVYEFVRFAQLLNYEDHRAMNQAFARNKQATGHVHWMGMNAWKSLRWNLMFQGSLETGGAMAGAKKGNAPLAPVYSFSDQRVEVLNQEGRSLKGMKLDYVVYSAESEKLENKTIDPSGAFFKPKDFSAYGDTVVLSLRLINDFGEIVARNAYTLSTGQTRLQHDQENWFRTPSETASTYGVRTLDENSAKVTSVTKVSARKYAVEITNRSQSKLSYSNLLKAYDQNGKYHAQTWSDNMLTLRPGESVEVVLNFLSEVMSPRVKVVKF